MQTLTSVYVFCKAHWSEILLVESAIASILPVKYSGVAQGIFNALSTIFTKNTTVK